MTDIPAPVRQPDGYIILAVNLIDATQRIFRIGMFVQKSVVEDEDEIVLPTYEEMRDEISDQAGSYEGLHFIGEMKEPAVADEWTEECCVQIPSTAYVMASWKYYTVAELAERSTKDRNEKGGK